MSPYLTKALLPKFRLQAATPAPVTPAGDAAAGSAAAQQEDQEQLRQAAVQEDGILAFDFAGTVSAVLTDHEQAAQASAEHAVPIADAVQEQLLVLDQVRGFGKQVPAELSKLLSSAMPVSWLFDNMSCLLEMLDPSRQPPPRLPPPAKTILAALLSSCPAAGHAGGGAAAADQRPACGPHHLPLLPGLHGRPPRGALGWDAWRVLSATKRAEV